MPGTSPYRRPCLFAALALSLSGCLDLDFDAKPGTLTVATTWPQAERARVEEAFRKESGSGSLARVRWVLLAPGDDLAALARRTHPPDVLLGGAAATYRRIDSEVGLEPLDDGRAWAVARHETIGAVGFDDPRTAPVSLARARSQLAANWVAGYGQLVQGAAVAPTSPGSQGQAAWVEGVAVPRGAAHPDEARVFVKAVAVAGADSDAEKTPALVESLLADMLGATLVDARDELLAARDALERVGRPQRLVNQLTEPPPWPPVSVAKLAAREGDAMEWLETLAGQVAPGPEARAWLLRSWLAPERAVDGAFLNELAGADGDLAREPRFRAWLRAEWTAWARQRYRRVARIARGEHP